MEVETKVIDDKPQRGIFTQYAEDLLRGTVEAIARAGAKAFESLTGDAAKAVDREKKKIEAVRDRVAQWRKDVVGEIGDSDPDGQV